MVAVLIKTQKIEYFFVRIAIIVAVLYKHVVRIFKMVCFFEEINVGAFVSFTAEKRFCA